MDRSGWCMKMPVTESNQAENDGCPEHFQTRSCACTCGHKGSRSLESRAMVFQPRLTPKPLRVDNDVP
jgi:hypothetical protein